LGNWTYVYFLKDHLGNTRVNLTSYYLSSNTNKTYTASGQIDYYPFGMERCLEGGTSGFSAIYNSGTNPYLFGGKEIDRMNGLNENDFTGRWYDPAVGRWGTVDQLAEKYYSISPYAYCLNNPVNAIDPDGRKILFINGYWAPGIAGSIIGSSSSGASYWGTGFAGAAQNFFNDHSSISSSNYIDGSSKWGGDMSGADRYQAGYDYADAHIDELTKGMKDGETFKMVTHSEGSAKGAGIAQSLIDHKYKVETIVHLSADEGDEFSTPTDPMTYQLGYNGDWVTGNKMISGTDKFGLVKSDLGMFEVHGSTKCADIFTMVSDLKTVQVQSAIGETSGYFRSWYYQVPGTTPNGTDFTNINGWSLMYPNGTKK